eukprot:gene19437-26095_t
MSMSKLTDLIPTKVPGVQSKEVILKDEDVRRPLFVGEVVYNKGIKRYTHGQQLLIVTGTELAVMDICSEDKAGSKESVYVERIPFSMLLQVQQKKLDLYLRYSTAGMSKTSPATFGYGEVNSGVPFSLTAEGPVKSQYWEKCTEEDGIVSSFRSADDGTHKVSIDDWSSVHLKLRDEAAMTAVVASINLAKVRVAHVMTVLRRGFCFQDRLEVSQIVEVHEHKKHVVQSCLRWSKQKDKILFKVPPAWSKLALAEGSLTPGGHACWIHMWTPLGMAVACLPFNLFLDAAVAGDGSEADGAEVQTDVLCVPAAKHAELVAHCFEDHSFTEEDLEGGSSALEEELKCLSPELRDEYVRVSEECAFLYNIYSPQEVVGMYPQQIRDLGAYGVMRISVAATKALAAPQCLKPLLAESRTSSEHSKSPSNVLSPASAPSPPSAEAREKVDSHEDREETGTATTTAAASASTTSPVGLVVPSFVQSMLIYARGVWNLLSLNVIAIAKQLTPTKVIKPDSATTHLGSRRGENCDPEKVPPFARGSSFLHNTFLGSPRAMQPSRTHVITIHGVRFCKELPLSLESQLAQIKSRSISQLTDAHASQSKLSSLPLDSSLMPTKSGTPQLLSTPEPGWLTEDVKARFLKLTKGNVHDAKPMAEATHKWRQDNNIDTFLTHRSVHTENFRFFQENLSHSLLRASKDGYVVQVIKAADFGKLSTAMKERGLTHEDLALRFALLFEFSWSKLAPQPLDSGRVVQMVDLKGITMSMALGEGLSCLKAITSITRHYPMRMHRTLMLNPPSYLNMAWSVIQKALDPVVAAKVKVANKQEALTELQHYMPLEMIPQEYGGGNPAPLEDYPPQQELQALLHEL